MKTVLYLLLTMVQFITIYASSYFREKAWLISDSAVDIPLPSRDLNLSYGFAVAWMIILCVFIVMAVIKKPSRELIILINIVVLPFIQIMWYILA